MANFVDKAPISGTKIRQSDGALLAEANIARIGIQVYRGAEVGQPHMDVVRVYRPAEEVFADDSMASAAHRPVTNDHPKELVTAENWRQYAVGQTGDEVQRDRKFLRVPLMVSDAGAIKMIDQGKRELSCGYTCDVEWTAGVTPEGEQYDAIQKNIRHNHLAIVAAGRAGHEVRIGDDGAEGWGVGPLHDQKEKRMSTRTIMVDGLQVETTDAGAAAIEKLQKDVKAKDEALAAKDAAITQAQADHDAALAKKDAEIDDLKGKVVTGADLDKLVADRANLIDLAKRIAGPDVKVAGLSDAEIKKAVVIAKGGAEMADKSEAYIDARFDILAESAPKSAAAGRDPFADMASQGNMDPDLDKSDMARQKRMDRMKSAYAGEKKEKA